MGKPQILGIHAMIYAKNVKGVRAFFRDVLGFRNVEAGGGWLIFALPPAELGIHPSTSNSHELYLMCDDVKATVAALKRRGARFTGTIRDAGYGLLTSIRLPGGGTLGLYQPKHPLAIRRAKRTKRASRATHEPRVRAKRA
jgi:predicted enzyme related to lactoylglutathione lyase